MFLFFALFFILKTDSASLSPILNYHSPNNQQIFQAPKNYKIVISIKDNVFYIFTKTKKNIKTLTVPYDKIKTEFFAAFGFQNTIINVKSYKIAFSFPFENEIYTRAP